MNWSEPERTGTERLLPRRLSRSAFFPPLRICDPPLSDNDLDPKRSRLFNLSRVVKRIYSVRFHGRGKDTDAHISIDPESLVPITVDISDCNDFKTSMDV